MNVYLIFSLASPSEFWVAPSFPAGSVCAYIEHQWRTFSLQDQCTLGQRVCRGSRGTRHSHLLSNWGKVALPRFQIASPVARPSHRSSKPAIQYLCCTVQNFQALWLDFHFNNLGWTLWLAKEESNKSHLSLNLYGTIVCNKWVSLVLLGVVTKVG